MNVDGLGAAKTLTALGEVFGLHPLELEDVTHTHQRAKLEEYPDHLFVVADMAKPAPAHPGQGLEHADGPVYKTEQISLFLGRGWVLTFQEEPGDCFGPVRERLKRKRGRIRDCGADYLFYALIDAILDSYFPMVESLGDRLERLDAEISEREGRGVVGRLHRLRGGLLVVRKPLWPHREMTNGLLRERNLITSETQVFLRDAHDHAQQLLELAETSRNSAATSATFTMPK
ncbi:MAG: CorA family divalent cation transporter [Planctomycetota bacterium]